MRQDQKTVMMWEGQNNTYWAKVRYWIGTGYQYVDYQVDKDTFELWNL